MHMDAIKDKRNNDTNNPPKFYRNIPIEEYIEGINVYLAGNIGGMNCPMSLLTRDNMLALEAAPQMAHKQPYSIKHGSVCEEMVQR